MDSECSLPCSQKPAICTYSETDSVQTLPPYFHKIHFNIITHLRLGSSSGLFPLGFPTKMLHVFLTAPMRAIKIARLIQLNLIILILWIEEYKRWSYSWDFLQPLVTSPSYVQLLSLEICSRRSSVCVSLSISEIKFHTRAKLQVN
jgi:hypothetical protein